MMVGPLVFAWFVGGKENLRPYNGLRSRTYQECALIDVVEYFTKGEPAEVCGFSSGWRWESAEQKRRHAI